MENCQGGTCGANPQQAAKQQEESIKKALGRIKHKFLVMSGKGGVGKTSLSVNLASYLTQHQKVVLTDLDVEEPNSGIFIKAEIIHSEDKFKMIPKWIPDDCTLCGICQKVCNFHAVIKMGTRIMVFPQLCHGCYACSELCPTKTLPMIPQKIGELNIFIKEIYILWKAKFSSAKSKPCR